MKPFVSACALALLATATIPALDWPAPESRLQSNFGQNLAGRTSTGLVFSGEATVRASEVGEVLFASDAGQSTVPSPLGSWVAVDHGDGIVSIYGRLEHVNGPFTRTKVERGEAIAQAGESGWSSGRNFFLSLIDRHEHRWVNPVIIAPARRDTRDPQIRSVYFLLRDGTRIPLSQVGTLKQGSYKVLVDAFDTEDDSPNTAIAPQKISCLVNGVEQGALYLDTIRIVDGRLHINRGTQTSPGDYPADGPYPLGEVRLSRGRTNIVVVARDANGNERSVSFGLTVE